MRSVASLDFIVSHLNDGDLAESAGRAVENIARHEAFRRGNRDALTTAIDKVLATTNDQALKERLNAQLDDLK